MMNMLEKVTQAMCPMNEPRCSKCRRKAKAAINALLDCKWTDPENGDAEIAEEYCKCVLREALKE